MSNCQIDDSGYPGFRDYKLKLAFSEGAIRFCRAHPAENWHIRGHQHLSSVAINVSFKNEPIQGPGAWPHALPPSLKLSEDVFEELEKIRSGLLD